MNIYMSLYTYSLQTFLAINILIRENIFFGKKVQIQIFLKESIQYDCYVLGISDLSLRSDSLCLTLFSNISNIVEFNPVR